MEAKTLFIGQNTIRLKSVDSTNSYLQKMLELSSVPEGTAVIAHEQHAGKGQRGNSWLSEPGKNLTFSLLLKPHFLSAQDHFMLNKVISLGISDALRELLGDEIKIKWPNDILIRGKKVCGILIENSLSGAAIQSSMIGIGLNVNQTDFKDLPAAFSLRSVFGKEFSLDELFLSLCSGIEKRYLQLRAGQAAQVNTDYLSGLFLLNTQADYIYKGEKIAAAITGVAGSGKLLLGKTNGEQVEADFKEIIFPH